MVQIFRFEKIQPIGNSEGEKPWTCSYKTDSIYNMKHDMIQDQIFSRGAAFSIFTGSVPALPLQGAYEVVVSAKG